MKWKECAYIWELAGMSRLQIFMLYSTMCAGIFTDNNLADFIQGVLQGYEI